MEIRIQLVRALAGGKVSMNNEKEQAPDSLRFERFAGLSAPAAGIDWNTYKSIEAIVKTPIESGNTQGTQPHA